MPIAPLDLQQLYMQQSQVSHMEHTRMAAKTILMQSEDKQIHQDSYEKDSTVVKSEHVSDENIIKDKKEKKKNNSNEEGYFLYRRKKHKLDSEEDAVEVVDEEKKEASKGKRLDILG